MALNTALKDDDPEIYNLIQEEKRRQFRGLELIASEVSSTTEPASAHTHGPADPRAFLSLSYP